MKKPKTKKVKQSKSRTSIWLADDLRRRLDRRAEKTGLSLARTISDTLHKGLSKSEGVADAAPETIFG